MFVHKMRNLRLKHRISLMELARGISRSHQWLFKLEQRDSIPSDDSQAIVCRAFEEVIASRRSALYALERDFYLHKNSLFEQVKESEPL